MPRPMTSLAQGFGLSLSLILAIGAQNAFVLRQGLRGEHVFAVVAICSLSEVALISAGVAGLGALVEAQPSLLVAFRWGGAAFLLAYGARAIVSAWRGGAVLEAGQAAGSLRAALATCLALTWLNPHVYLDTVILLGGIGATAPAPWLYALGAMSASILFFAVLGYGAGLLRPVFARPGAWRVLDAFVGLVMWAIAAGLVLG
ncbi:MAG: LysE/ArgO family amino acid transporter [Pseudomonadota bacterium]